MSENVHSQYVHPLLLHIRTYLMFLPHPLEIPLPQLPLLLPIFALKHYPSSSHSQRTCAGLQVH